MAGYDPCGVNSDADLSNNFSGVTVSSTQLQIKADLNGNNPLSNNCQSTYKGIDMTSQENIIYAFDATNHQITRNIGSGAQPFIENVQSFGVDYLTDNINVPTTNSHLVRQIRITIIGRTTKPDPSYSLNGGYRTYKLTAIVAPRNLAY